MTAGPLAGDVARLGRRDRAPASPWTTSERRGPPAGAIGQVGNVALTMVLVKTRTEVPVRARNTCLRDVSGIVSPATEHTSAGRPWVAG
jgi:hypothetical protein